MAITSGTRLGTYEIVAPIGAGGMGEVYQARDTKLGRSVAIKVLPKAFAADPERVARFEREGKVLASLNHPHIAALHGMEESRGEHFLIMELVEGETLADRIFGGARGAPRPLEVDEAVPIARQIAQALEAAHEQGIIHRDLKPANIKLRPDGTVKVLDFGLAKALERATAVEQSAMTSPTITTPAMTQLGVILGTAAYMSPEQAKGRAADKRSDMWAFGCVLYEMLSGRRAFEGDDVSDTLASVLKAEPDWTALPSNLPQSIRALVQGCLRKDRRERIGDISTALFLLNQPQSIGAAAPLIDKRQPSLWGRAALVIAGVTIGAAAAIVVMRKPAASPLAPVTRFAIVVPQDQPLVLPRNAVAISPDGTRVVYAAAGRLFLRSLAELEARPISGAEPAIQPVFSPDGQSLLYWTDGTIKRIAVTGGTALTICRAAPAPSGVSWDDHGILFAQPGTGIMRVAATGGIPELLIAATNPADGIVSEPQLLPDGDSVLFTLGRRTGGTSDFWDTAKIVVQSLKTGKRVTLVEGGTGARYLPTGHIVYAISGTLLAVPFDANKLAVSGGPVPIVEGVRRSTAATVGSAHFAFSTSGSLVYVPGPTSGAGQALMLFDRTGAAEALKLPPGAYAFPRVSPDGKRLAFESSDGKQTNVFIYDLFATSSPRRLTFGGNNRFPIWSSDGRRIVFQSDRDGDAALFWQPADGGAVERLTKPDSGAVHVPEAWSPKDDLVLFNITKGSETSLWILSLRDRKPSPVADTRSSGFPTDAAFSPDGRWIAYQVGEMGRGEATTFVQPFPPTGTKYEIAPGGRPLWSRKGTELFFVPAPNEFRVVSVKTEPIFSFTAPVAVPRGFGVADPASPRPYDVMPDGRILGVGAAAQAQSGSPAQMQLDVVLNWFEELKARVPTK